jgi:4-hydroxy-3-polyprenylbenzoate decarboxylase
MKSIILAMTGASGGIYGQRLLERLVSSDVHTHVVISPAAKRVFYDELGIRNASVERLLGSVPENVTAYTAQDIGARIASGSFPVDGMVIVPCSGNTLAAVANGIADNLITRAAAVTLKEARRLVLVPREMPLAAIEIENMLRISRSGGLICPACPGFYMRPQSVDDIVNFVVGRIMDLLGVAHSMDIRWEPRPFDES